MPQRRKEPPTLLVGLGQKSTDGILSLMSRASYNIVSIMHSTCNRGQLRLLPSRTEATNPHGSRITREAILLEGHGLGHLSSLTRSVLTVGAALRPRTVCARAPGRFQPGAMRNRAGDWLAGLILDARVVMGPVAGTRIRAGTGGMVLTQKTGGRMGRVEGPNRLPG